MPTNPLHDLLSIIFRAFFRLEVTGLENVAKAGPNAIIALNHVSFLDAALALSFLERDPVFAIDSGIAQRWWVKPFLKLTRAHAARPDQADGDAHADPRGARAANPLIIFPEGRITVTGSLMKVYDGAGLIADKSGAMVVPVRIEGLERPTSRGSAAARCARRLFPKVTVTILRAGQAQRRSGAARASSGAWRPVPRSTRSCPTWSSAPPRPTAPSSRR